MKLHIKNMMCIRCKMVVKKILDDLNIGYVSVELGEVELYDPLSDQDIEALRKALPETGLELMDSKKSLLIEKIKHIIIALVHKSREPLAINLSNYLSEQLGYDYTYLANLFSEVQGITIEKFLITQKIDRVKELLVYNELNLTEIAFMLHYSSVSHLSTQFKKVTGLTPSHFKVLLKQKRSLAEAIKIVRLKNNKISIRYPRIWLTISDQHAAPDLQYSGVLLPACFQK